MTRDGRTDRTRAADAHCTAALAAAVAGGVTPGVALVAVGGYGRRELAPYSDLDVVLLHSRGVDVSDLAPRVWYRLWDSPRRLDHSVRSEDEVLDLARADPRVALGLLDLRHVAGDDALTLRVRAGVLARWRREARAQLPELRRLAALREGRVAELGHASVPDLKEAPGGLREATILRALMMTWLVEVPHADLERCRQRLLDVRDVLHEVAGRATDRIAPEHWEPMSAALGFAEAEDAQRYVRALGRRISHLSRISWHRVDAVLARPTGTARRPRLEPIGPGVALASGEVVLARGADPARDPHLLLRAAAAAAERGSMLAPATAARLARDGASLPEPWSAEARHLLTRLLAAGPGLLPVWETLEETGALSSVLPEWERVRLLPHASLLHRFTVDRHLVETCVEASRLLRQVARPDLLMLAALLHDIGKGGRLDHCVAGEPIARATALRIGLSGPDAAVVATLVRRHLLLADVATTRDLDDPSTVTHVASLVGDRPTLDLLEVLTQADARATAPKAWSPWRASLVAELARRVRAVLAGAHVEPDGPPDEVEIPAIARAGGVAVAVRREADGSSVTVIAPDRVGLMAVVAGALAVQHASVLAARAWTQGEYAVSVWHVDDEQLDPSITRSRLDAVLRGSLDPAARLRVPPGSLEPVVQVRHDASAEATVLEVRTQDRPGVVFLVCRELADLDLSVRSAHVSTIGPQALDVFYVQEPGAGALTDVRAAAAVHAVRSTLTGDAQRGSARSRTHRRWAQVTDP